MRCTWHVLQAPTAASPCPWLPPARRRRFQAAGPFWGRQYLFWHGRRPLTLIYEVFSTALEELLGPARASE